MVTWGSASADFGQNNPEYFPIDLAIDADKSTGWTIYPEMAERHCAVFIPSRPITAADITHLTIRLAFQSKHPIHALGRSGSRSVKTRRLLNGKRNAWPA